MTTVWVLHREISDQMGTEEVVGVYSTEEKARAGDAQCPRRRTFIKPMELDPDQPLPIRR